MKEKTKFYVDPNLKLYGEAIIKEMGGQKRLEGIRYIDQVTIRVFWTDLEDNGKLTCKLVSPLTEN